ncbi:hypothetical protein AURDEDRAFT_110252 [Auricularia subglabra TFB-10046 SS5]|nr:hypothetical protein AURDEDRAFT_110252 [Auricularia subglabra TFB-10046 SS5]
MARFTAVALLFIAAVAQAAPVRLTRRQCVDTDVAVDVPDFASLTYNDVQISSGVAGNAAAEANAIFVTPFDGVNRADIPDETQDAIETLRKAAESAETELFNPALDEATGDEKKALQVGKIKNKVLKLTAESFVLEIKLAKAQADGKDTASIQKKLEDEQTKLAKNVDTDKKSAGQASLPVV